MADEIDAVEAGITSLTQADGLEDLLERADTVRSDVEELVSGIGDAVSCD
jgi:hypothetical protein